MPILVADGRAPGTLIVSRNATVFEFTPYELGSWDPQLYGMAPMKYMGSSYDAGKLVNETCVEGLDNAGFVMGTSSSMFNMVATKVVQGAGGLRVAMFDNLMNDLALRLINDDNDIASWSPNPFYEWRKGQSISESKRLSLVDGGEDDQNIPLQPLIQPKREVDVIFAVDSSADTIATGSTVSVPLGNWPNGTSLQATYLRSLSSMANGTGFPAVPDSNTFINLGLNNGPAFFGCDVANMSKPTPPLVVYLPNSPYTFWSNLSTLTSAMPDNQSKAMIHNGYNMATMANGTRYRYWDQCVGCAILSRSFTRTKTAVPKRCTQCFTQFCWNGTKADTPIEYDPKMYGNEETPPPSEPEVSRGLATGMHANSQAIVVASITGMLSAVIGGHTIF
jgi:lysophospholipase